MPAGVPATNGRPTRTLTAPPSYDLGDLPRGTVTFLFTDVEGSTLLLKQLGAHYGEVLAEHQRILRRAFAAHRGREVDTQGDSFFVAFPRAKDAVAAAVDGQRDLAAHAWPDCGAVKVRMGLHSGEPTVEAKRYVGIGVHKAARIAAAGHGGQVLLSRTTRELVEDELPPGVGIRDLGEYRLKDIDGREPVAQLVIEGLPSRFPPLRTLDLERRRRRRRLCRRSAVAALVVFAAVVSVFLLHLGSGGGGGAVKPNSLAAIDSSGHVLESIPVGGAPSGIAVGGGAVWMTDFSANRVSRIDLRTHTVRQTLTVGSGSSGIVFGDGAIWVTNSLDATVSRVDPASNTVVERVPVGSGASGVAFGLGTVWVANTGDHTISRIDPRSDKVTAMLPAGGGAAAIAVAHGAVWTANPVEGTVSRIDPNTRTITSVHVGNGPQAIAAGAGAVWVANSRDGTVSRIDPRTNAITATTSVGNGPVGLGIAGDAVWVATEFDGTLTRLNARTGAVAATRKLGASPVAVAAADDRVWVALGAAAAGHRGGTAITEVPLERIDVDSAIADEPVSWGILSITGDGLTGVKRTGGSLQLVPDLAVALPTESPTRTTYTLTLRRGIRYSNGAPVRASDFRRAIERDFKLASPGAFYYRAVRGAATCLERPRRCNLARGIVTDDPAGTVTFRLTRPDPELMWKLTLPFAHPIPPRTPNAVQNHQAIPGTGPYMVATPGPKELRLVRNPYFREWSRAAQPDGYPNEIVFALRPKLDDAAAIRAVDRGELDWISWTEPSTARELLLRHRSRLRVNPWHTTTYMVLNTRLPPFDDVRVRRALNYAVDRNALVKQEGGRLFASPTCQVLPPGFPGHRRYCPYPGPDLAKAQSLIDASGTEGMNVTVWTMAVFATDSGRYFVSLLNRLGYHAKLKQLPMDMSYFTTIQDSRNKVQIAWDAWGPDYPAASTFINALLSCRAYQPGNPANSNAAGFCDRRIDAQMQRALTLEATNRQAANALWARIDRQITDQAPWVAKTNHNFVALLSKRVGNYQYNPQLGMLIDQLWVR